MSVVLIGGAGSVIRFLADGVVAPWHDFPLGTLAVNVSGAAVLGLITGLALGHGESLLAGSAARCSTCTGGTRLRPASCCAAPKGSGSSTTCAPTGP